MSENPSDIFYWNDWENDPAVRLCSLAAQGLWMRCLCICARAEPRGFLLVAGRLVGTKDLSRLTGYPEAEVEALMAELALWGVYSADSTGRIYNRRMVRATNKTRASAAGGKKGGKVTYEKQRGIFATQGPTQEPPQGPTQGTTQPLLTSLSSKDSTLQKEEESSLRSPKKTEGARLPEGWRPDEVSMAKAAADLGGRSLAEHELEKFRDYWRGIPGGKGRKRDWLATWRNWVRWELDHRSGRKAEAADPFRGVL